MSWLSRLLGGHDPIAPVPDETQELEEARGRRQDLMVRLVMLGVEADVLLADEQERKAQHD